VTGDRRILRLLRRFALAVLAAGAAALVAALPAAGKEGVEATLLTRIPLDAPAGKRLEVAWKLTYSDHGRRRPFGANGVFVRLRSAIGASAETGLANGNGDYRATVVVPEGGIGDVQIGLRGWTNDAAGTRESDALFPISNDPLPGTVRSRSGWPSWIVVLVAAPLAVLAVLVVRQRRPVRTARLRAQPSSKAQSR
jgi:hypothetical protein